MALERFDHPVLNRDDAWNPARAEPQQHALHGVAAALGRTAVMVVLASLAILVLLPAAIAAQAASAL